MTVCRDPAILWLASFFSHPWLVGWYQVSGLLSFSSQFNYLFYFSFSDRSDMLHHHPEHAGSVIGYNSFFLSHITLHPLTA
jgi:hypothetical protein